MSPDPKTLYYLVRRGTNSRVVSKDGEPVLVERAYVTVAQDKYEQLLRDELVPMTIPDWLDHYWVPVLQAKHEAYNRTNPGKPAPTTEGALTREEV